MHRVREASFFFFWCSCQHPAVRLPLIEALRSEDVRQVNLKSHLNFSLLLHSRLPDSFSFNTTSLVLFTLPPPTPPPPNTHTHTHSAILMIFRSVSLYLFSDLCVSVDARPLRPSGYYTPTDGALTFYCSHLL